ncbi:MAG: C-GCAxxG-C-C family protein [Clostridiales bacterium]|jgi:hypothetical protein|nr:C-GCAxxG-C-C family protein [Clostridiales bacterium]
MRNSVIKYYEEGLPCAQCLIRSASEKYAFSADKPLMDAFSALSGGLGCGLFCGAGIAAIAIFGILFEETVAMELTIAFLTDFNAEYKTFDCCKIRNTDCLKALIYVSDKIEELIEQGEEDFA